MAYALSPGVTVTERDFTTIVPAVSSTMGAFAGGFQWGPVLYPIQLSTENELVAQFGKPNSNNFEDFFTAANFLSYSGGMWISRKDSSTGKNAVGVVTTNANSANGTGAGTAIKIKNTDDYTNNSSVYQANTYEWASKYPGTFGNSLKVSFADSATFTGKALTAPTSIITSLSNTSVAGTGTKFLTELHIGAVIKNAAGATVGTIASIASDTAATLTANANIALSSEASVTADWVYAAQFDSAPGTSTYAANANATNDELHIVVIDANGTFSGSAGTILEKFAYVSKASDAKTTEGLNNFYKDVINEKSKYIWWIRHNPNVTGTTAWGSVAAGSTFKSLVGAMSTTLAGGVDDFTDASGAYAQAAWSLYLDDSTYDINLLPLGKATVATANYVIQNICEVRKDCMAFVSPMNAVTLTNISTYTIATGSSSTATAPLVAFRNALTSSSYAFLDSGFKYQYDRYNDAYRWVPLSGDTAGLTARADYTNDPWWSPAGYNRGIIKNVIKLAVNPTKTDRDTLYQNGINPVVSFPGNGIILFGDKTMTGKPSAFDRINVRRLFITLEKAISIASKYSLFEFNDSFTQAQFKNMVEPYLRDVQGRRGITDFRVKCDSTNNTGEVVDRNEFVADIYIKPARSINYITLSFIATRTGVDFTTIGA